MLKTQYTKRINDRHKSEIEFHDRKAKKRKKETFYSQGAITPTFNKLIELAGNLENKRLLDFGCGQGWSSAIYAKKKAEVIGVDISFHSLKNAKKLCEKEDLKITPYFIQASCENLPFRSEFDVIIGIAILHHLDLELSIKSIKTSLKDGGIAIFMEPLNHNPVINIFRKLTPKRRTADEKPLTFSEVQSLRKDFRTVSIYGYGFLSLFAFVFSTIKAYSLFRRSTSILTKIDQKIFKAFPSIQKYCWGTIIVLEK